MRPPSIVIHGGEGAEAPTCFLCEEGGGPGAQELFRICRCNVFVHLACQRKLMASTPSHAVGCPVCQTPYSNTTTSTRTRVSYEGRRIVCYVVGVISLALVALVEYLIWLFVEQHASYLAIASTFLGTAICFGIIGAMVFRGVPMTTSVSRVVVQRPLHTPSTRRPSGSDLI